MVKLSPSVLTADFLTLKEVLGQFESAGVDMLHLDVMDGIFVPNISFGIPVIQSLRKYVNTVFDVHLMITQPEKYIQNLIDEREPAYKSSSKYLINTQGGKLAKVIDDILATVEFDDYK